MAENAGFRHEHTTKQFVTIREIRGRKRQDSFATNDTNSHENKNQFVKIREIRGRKRQDSFATNDTNSHENKNQFVKIREIRGRKRLPCADASIDPN
ncbi:MAG: hypothetical protein IPO15_23885 [Anaerolineae bacterium]|uniref:hypothetical protein n=1 Tax=Candidatus Amarolinea dominans TaxID=3140696 RepID=UPI003136F840|nr:hypothetical protein [Anaerolineae bacterium]